MAQRIFSANTYKVYYYIKIIELDNKTKTLALYSIMHLNCNSERWALFTQLRVANPQWLNGHHIQRHQDHIDLLFSEIYSYSGRLLEVE